ncbi:DeoR/GlpR family DNA-binding transcription regulator [Methylophaga muralis]|uniref:Glycerol-3-phosphate regulon repressor n=1 Tax=Methylophaga muralis TaxID=291169 RepID=A0A1E3GNP3_9GAMM|nr:DeoR/GlpR family DNA-binding transcription regulator [Methylophaga muralis]ODN65640.1 Glycerol-3-phosphate regulon repressor [Methylophaga muralis]
MSRKKAARHKSIIDELTIHPSMRVNELASALNVTTETIRRDLEELAEQNLISRTYGGALLRQAVEPVLNERHKTNIAERVAIAKKAAPILKEAKVLMIGSGVTTVEVAKRIAYEMNNITVITHSFGVATVLSLNPTIKVIMAPGLYHAEEGSTHGSVTCQFLTNYTVDWTILGASGLAPTGPSDALVDAADVYKQMIRQSTHNMIVADHSKFDRLATARYAKWDEIDNLITDKKPSGPLKKALSKAEVQIIVATVQ